MTFEALGCLSGQGSENSVIDSEVWPGELSLSWRDAVGQTHRLEKLIGEDVRNLDDEDLGPTSFAIDCYGQGETTRLGQRARDNPLALLDYLDRFVDLNDAKAAEDAARDALLDLQERLEEAERNVAQIPRYERDLATIRQQLTASAKANAAQIIELQRTLADEREIRVRIRDIWREVREIAASRALHERLELIRTVAEPSAASVGRDELQTIVSAVVSFVAEVATLDVELHRHTTKLGETLTEQLRVWKTKDETTKREIETKRQDLEAQGVRLDMAFIQKLAADEAKCRATLETLKGWKTKFAKLKIERANLLKQRWSARERIATIRVAYAKSASETLRLSLEDLNVTLKFVPNGYAPEAAEQIKHVMGWRTNQVPRATLLTQGLTLPRLLDAVESNDVEAIVALAFSDGTQPFNAQDAKDIIARLSEVKVKYALERCAVHEFPRLLVTKKVTRNGKDVHLTREFSKLSLGQQQSILLTLLLSSDGSDPLIIDQPEDNLDGEFIYSSLVPVLRRAKERRQIIIVTHNANIAVLGDAELIVVFKAHGEGAVITTRGSIDNETTRKEACNVLEGARAAFLRRAKIYGVKAR
jgi:hypothetical protein